MALFDKTVAPLVYRDMRTWQWPIWISRKHA